MDMFCIYPFDRRPLFYRFVCLGIKGWTPTVDLRFRILRKEGEGSTSPSIASIIQNGKFWIDCPQKLSGRWNSELKS